MTLLAAHAHSQSDNHTRPLKDRSAGTASLQATVLGDPPMICALHLHRKGLWLPQLVCKGRGAQRTVWDCSIMTLWEISPSSY